MDDFIWYFIFDPMEEYIKAQIEAQLLRGTDPELSEVCGIEGGDPSEE